MKQSPVPSPDLLQVFAVRVFLLLAAGAMSCKPMRDRFEELGFFFLLLL